MKWYSFVAFRIILLMLVGPGAYCFVDVIDGVGSNVPLVSAVADYVFGRNFFIHMLDIGRVPFWS